MMLSTRACGNSLRRIYSSIFPSKGLSRVIEYGVYLRLRPAATSHTADRRWRAVRAVPGPGTEIDKARVQPACSPPAILTGGHVQAFLDGDACVVHHDPAEAGAGAFPSTTWMPFTTPTRTP